MSPMEPLSPTLMDLSPISPSRARALASTPNTPVIEPSLCLPRLVTSFQNPNSISGSVRSAPVQYVLPTPSPLSLNQMSAMSEIMQGSLQHRRRYSSSVEDAGTTKISPTTSSSTSSERSPDGNTHSSNSPLVTRSTPALVRQNANEGLIKLLRDRRRWQQDTQRRTVAFHCRDAASTYASPTNVSGTTLLTPRPRSRSPISKRGQQHRPTHRRIVTQVANSKSAPVLIIRPPVSPTTQSRNHEIRARIAHLSQPLVPLVSMDNGQAHPDFPTSILQYQVLTHDQLDNLARWYHQTEDAGEIGRTYPMPIPRGKVWVGTKESANKNVDLQTKRRRWGRFIGLRGCESPEGEETVEELEARMEREWRAAIRRAREADAAKDKMGRDWY